MAESYASIRPKLDTGDIVLFAGSGWGAAVIRWVTRSQWSHVGMVVRVADWDLLLLWESVDVGGAEDIETGTVTRGVQLVPLSERLRRQRGSVAVRRLVTQRSQAQLGALRALRLSLRGRPYEQNALELLRSAAALPYPIQAGEDLSSLFCSELVVEAYQAMGLIPETEISSEYTPADFAAGGAIDEALEGAHLEAEQEIAA